jgi:hypothetical protein
MPLRKRSVLEIARRRTDVRYWPKADIPSCNAHVRFRGQSGHHFLHRICLLLTQSGHCSRAAERLTQKYFPPAFWSRRVCMSVMDLNAAVQLDSLHDATALQPPSRLSSYPYLFLRWSKSGSGTRHICGPWKLPRYSPADESICG